MKSDFVGYRLETFEKQLVERRLRPLEHSRIMREVEELVQTMWNMAYQAGHEDGMATAADKLTEVATWCRTNGFEARARHTLSAAARLSPTEADQHKCPEQKEKT